MVCNDKQRKLCSNENCNICLKRSFATHEKSKYWSSRNDGKPRNYFLKSDKKFWFDCNKCKHDFETALSNVANNRWCPYYANKKLCIDDDCDDCYQKSFKSHENSKYWSSKNGVCKPRDYFKGSDKKFWFDCDNCKHDFEATLSSIVNGKTWCPYCANKKLCIDDDCYDCYQKSFASHEKSTYWDYVNNKGTPRDYFLNCTKKFWFDCDKCKHVFDASLSKIVNGNTWCPFCASKKLCDNEKCNDCFNKSFESHKKSKYWDYKNNDGCPRDYFLNSHSKFWFNCKNNHNFETRLDHIVTDNSWCPLCNHKTESIIL